MALPRSTVTSTLALVGIGIAMVIALLIFAFTTLNRGSGKIPANPTGTPQNFSTPTPEYFPNEGFGENVTNQPVNDTGGTL